MFVLFCVVELYIHRDHMQIRHTILAPFLYLTYTTTQKTKTPATLTDLEYVSPITSIFHGPYWVIGKCYSESDLLFVDCTHGWCLLLPCSFAAAWQLICDSFIKYTYTCYRAFNSETVWCLLKCCFKTSRVQRLVLERNDALAHHLWVQVTPTLWSVCEWAVKVQFCLVFCANAVSVLCLFDAAGLLDPSLQVQEASHHSQNTHSDEDHHCHQA